MAYRNAQELFPEGLLKQIQRYVSGETIYVPAREEKKAWGETSGYQQYIRERNREIRQGFEQGKTIDQLMDKYALSYDSIKRIVYSRKEIAMLKYSATCPPRKPMRRRENWTPGFICISTRTGGTSPSRMA